MEGGVFEAITAWSNDQISIEKLRSVLEGSKATIAEHQLGFSAVVDGLLPRQVERCRALIGYALSLLELLEWELDEALDGLANQDRSRLFQAGDHMARARFQLNQTFVEFSHQALRALGPTEIPSLNHLLALRDELLAQPGPAAAAELRQAVEAEAIIAARSLADLIEQAEVPEAMTLRNAFRDHGQSLEALARRLESPPYEAAVSSSVFDVLEKSYREIAALLPVVQMKLRSQGQTQLPDLNILLGLLDQVEIGQLGDMPVMEALELVEASFAATESKCQLTVSAEPSVLIAQEIRATLETFEIFREGVDSVYRFLEERDLVWLRQGRAQLLEFGSRFLAHKERLDQLREQQGKVLCPFCGHFNQPGLARCQRCANPLPLNLGLPETSSTFEVLDYRPDQGANDLLVTNNLAPVYEAIRAISEGRMNKETFLAVLEKFESTLESGVDRLPAEPSSGDDNASALYDLLDEGLEEVSAALQLLRSYPGSGDQTLLLGAIRKLDAGVKKIAEAGSQARRVKE